MLESLVRHYTDACQRGWRSGTNQYHGSVLEYLQLGALTETVTVSAEYGEMGGGAVNMALKSGSN